MKTFTAVVVLIIAGTIIAMQWANPQSGGLSLTQKIAKLWQYAINSMLGS